MPIEVLATPPPAGQPAADLDAVIAGFDAVPFHPGEAESLAHAADWLARLGANRTFLGDILIAELANQVREPLSDSGYGPQVLLLRTTRSGVMLRANLWPAAQDRMVQAGGGGSFAYGLAHDHNFSFLTCGYFGPGYWSDYYEYDAGQVTGWRGEPVPSLRFVERSRLSEGRMLFYRASIDVHVQHPPDALSISLNLMAGLPEAARPAQYAFDLKRRTIAGRLGAGASAAALRIAAAHGSAAGLDLVEHFAARHPCDRMRLSAWEALACLDPDPARVWARAENCGSRLVAKEARMRSGPAVPVAAS